MEDQNESIMKQMEETRSSLTDKLEALETQVAGTVQPVAQAVERAAEAATEIVQNVKETVHEVTEKVGDTVESVSDTFNLSRQFARHPWVALGVVSTVGCMIGFSRARRSRTPAPMPAPPRQARPTGDGRFRRAAETPPEPRQEDWFADEIRRLKGLAVGALMGAVRDLVKHALPGPVGNRLAEELDTITSRFGGEPFREPVLGEAESPARSRPGSRERTEAVARDGGRMRTGGAGSGLN